jgi:hypothetical protein
MSLSRYKVSSMEKYDKEITKLSTSIILLQCRRTRRRNDVNWSRFGLAENIPSSKQQAWNENKCSIPIFLSWKGKLAASTKVKIIPTPLLHYFCSAPPPPEIESQLRAWFVKKTILFWKLVMRCDVTPVIFAYETKSNILKREQVTKIL